MNYIRDGKIKVSCLRYNQLTEREFDNISALPFYVMKNNVWEKGKVIRPTVPEKYPIRRLSQKIIPGIDGYPLLWLEVEFREP